MAFRSLRSATAPCQASRLLSIIRRANESFSLELTSTTRICEIALVRYASHKRDRIHHPELGLFALRPAGPAAARNYRCRLRFYRPSQVSLHRPDTRPVPRAWIRQLAIPRSHCGTRRFEPLRLCRQQSSKPCRSSWARFGDGLGIWWHVSTGRRCSGRLSTNRKFFSSPTSGHRTRKQLIPTSSKSGCNWGRHWHRCACSSGRRGRSSSRGRCRKRVSGIHDS
jgi:hypothetical protein